MPILNVDVTYKEGYYIAVCSEIHLVTESISLDDLKSMVRELAPDLVELNKVDIDPMRLIFNFQRSQSVEEAIFKAKVKPSDDQIEEIRDIYIETAKKYELKDISLSYECYEGHDIYAMRLNTSTKSIERICDANWELAKRFVDSEMLESVDFSIMFEYDNDYDELI